MAPQRNAWHHLYKTARWQRRRDRQLSEQPLCERCLLAEVIEPATVAHHVVPHKGDVTLFFEGELESLCKSHHDSHGQLEDHGKRPIMFDADGWPV